MKTDSKLLSHKTFISIHNIFSQMSFSPSRAGMSDHFQCLQLEQLTLTWFQAEGAADLMPIYQVQYRLQGQLEIRNNSWKPRL